MYHRRLKFYAVTHNNPKNPEYLIAISLLQVRHLIYLFFDNFGAQLQAPVYVLTWRCIQDEFYVIFMQPCLNKLLQSQAEVCVLVVNAKQVYQSSV